MYKTLKPDERLQLGDQYFCDGSLIREGWWKDVRDPWIGKEVFTMAARRKIQDVSQKSTHNKQMDAISAIKGALKIKDLWRPPDSVEITEDDPSWGEFQALQTMLKSFESVVQKQHP